MKLIICSECGKQVNEDANYCPSCGIKLPGNSYSSFSTEIDQFSDHVYYQKEQLRKKKRDKIFINTIAVIIGLIIISFLFDSSEDDTSKTNNSGIGVSNTDTSNTGTFDTETYDKATYTIDDNSTSLWGSNLYLAEALVMSEEFVKKYLVSPSTAIFPTPTSLDCVTYSNDQYTVTSYVDSQNRFGAMIRTNYIAILKRTGHQRYSLVDIIFSE